MISNHWHSKLWIVAWPSWFCLFSFQMQFTSYRKNPYPERRYINKYLIVFVSWSPYWFYGFVLMRIVFWWILAWLIQQLVRGIKLWHNHARNLLQVDYTSSIHRCLQIDKVLLEMFKQFYVDPLLRMQKNWFQWWVYKLELVWRIPMNAWKIGRQDLLFKWWHSKLIIHINTQQTKST